MPVDMVSRRDYRWPISHSGADADGDAIAKRRNLPSTASIMKSCRQPFIKRDYAYWSKPAGVPVAGDSNSTPLSVPIVCESVAQMRLTTSQSSALAIAHYRRTTTP